MAIFHMSIKPISRSTGRSAVAAAAYRSGDLLHNALENKWHDFSQRPGVFHAEIVLPKGVEAKWALNRETLWNKVEASERRKDARVAREVEIALPCEIKNDQRVELTRLFAKEICDTYGCVVDAALHAPHTEGDQRNFHAHLLLSTRQIKSDGFGEKTHLERSNFWLKSRNLPLTSEQMTHIRQRWSEIQNAYFEKIGLDIRVDHRSLKDQGIDLEPTLKVGVATTALKRKGVGSLELDRLETCEVIRSENAKRIEKKPQIILDVLSREKSVFDERDIAKLLHRYVDDGPRFQSLLTRVIQHKNCVRLTAHGASRDRLTTREMVRLEARMMKNAHWLSKDIGLRTSSAIQERILKSSKISEEQQASVERITGRGRLSIVVGRAGSGKTTKMMKVAREIWEESGYRVVGGALAGKAAEGLQKEAGIESTTLAAWELKFKSGAGKFDEKTVFVMDEAGMVSSKQMAKFLSLVKHSGAKLVLVGDADQLQPIEAGAAFRAIAETVGYSELGTIWRQKEEWMRTASMDFAKGQVEKALEAYSEKKAIISCEHADAAKEELIADWKKTYSSEKLSLILAHSRKSVLELNMLARSSLKERGILSNGSIFETEVGKREFSLGDQVLFLKNDSTLGVKNGTIGKVVEASSGKFVAEISDGQNSQRVEVDQAVYRNVDHGYAVTVHKAQGATVDQVHVLATPNMDKQLTYVAMTRHRENVKVFYSGPSFEHAGGLHACLSRDGAKETTLDYRIEKPYAAAFKYATRRGLEAFSAAKAFFENKMSWGQEKKEMQEAKCVQEPPHVQKDLESLKKAPIEGVLFSPIVSWSTTLLEEASTRVQDHSELKHLSDSVHFRIEQIFKDPEAAKAKLNFEAVAFGSTPQSEVAREKLLDTLAKNPEHFGELRGKDGWLASKGSKAEREQALKTARSLSQPISEWHKRRGLEIKRASEQISKERKASQERIPPLSKKAEKALQQIKELLERNESPRELIETLYKKKALGEELSAFSKAVTRRFGDDRAFYQKPEGAHFENLASRVVPSERQSLKDIWPLLKAAQRFEVTLQSQTYAKQNEQRLAREQRKDQSLGR